MHLGETPKGRQPWPGFTVLDTAQMARADASDVALCQPMLAAKRLEGLTQPAVMNQPVSVCLVPGAGIYDVPQGIQVEMYIRRWPMKVAAVACHLELGSSALG